jgi:hypothetical protein
VNQLVPLGSHSLTIPKPLPIKRPEPNWRHIVGIHVENHSDFAAVWLGHETSHKGVERVTVYDSVIYPRGTHFAVIADDLKLRGGWKPIAWRRDDEEYIEALRERGCLTLGFSKKEQAYEETQAICAANALKIDERLTTGGFVVLETNTVWLREYESFGPKDGQIPQEGFPLMSATRHAFNYLSRAVKWPEPSRPIKYESLGVV